MSQRISETDARVNLVKLEQPETRDPEEETGNVKMVGDADIGQRHNESKTDFAIVPRTARKNNFSTELVSPMMSATSLSIQNLLVKHGTQKKLFRSDANDPHLQKAISYKVKKEYGNAIVALLESIKKDEDFESELASSSGGDIQPDLKESQLQIGLGRKYLLMGKIYTSKYESSLAESEKQHLSMNNIRQEKSNQIELITASSENLFNRKKDPPAKSKTSDPLSLKLTIEDVSDARNANHWFNKAQERGIKVTESSRDAIIRAVQNLKHKAVQFSRLGNSQSAIEALNLACELGGLPNGEIEYALASAYKSLENNEKYCEMLLKAEKKATANGVSDFLTPIDRLNLHEYETRRDVNMPNIPYTPFTPPLSSVPVPYISQPAISQSLGFSRPKINIMEKHIYQFVGESMKLKEEKSYQLLQHAISYKAKKEFDSAVVALKESLQIDTEIREITQILGEDDDLEKSKNATVKMGMKFLLLGKISVEKFEMSKDRDFIAAKEANVYFDLSRENGVKVSDASCEPLKRAARGLKDKAIRLNGLEKYDEAIECLEIAFSMGGLPNGDVEYALAQIYKSNNGEDSCYSMLLQAEASGRKLVGADVLFIHLYEQKKDIPQSRREFQVAAAIREVEKVESAPKVSTRSDQLLQHAINYKKKKEYDNAIITLLESIAMDQSDTNEPNEELKTSLGRKMFLMGKLYLDKYLESDKNDINPAKNGWFWLKKAAEKGIKVTEGTKEPLMIALLREKELAEKHFFQNEFQEAIECYENCISFGSLPNGEIEYLLAMVYKKLENNVLYYQLLLKAERAGKNLPGFESLFLHEYEQVMGLPSSRNEADLMPLLAQSEKATIPLKLELEKLEAEYDQLSLKLEALKSKMQKELTEKDIMQYYDEFYQQELPFAPLMTMLNIFEDERNNSESGDYSNFFQHFDQLQSLGAHEKALFEFAKTFSGESTLPREGTALWNICWFGLVKNYAFAVDNNAKTVSLNGVALIKKMPLEISVSNYDGIFSNIDPFNSTSKSGSPRVNPRGKLTNISKDAKDNLGSSKRQTASIGDVFDKEFSNENLVTSPLKIISFSNENVASTTRSPAHDDRQRSVTCFQSPVQVQIKVEKTLSMSLENVKTTDSKSPALASAIFSAPKSLENVPGPFQFLSLESINRMNIISPSMSSRSDSVKNETVSIHIPTRQDDVDIIRTPKEVAVVSEIEVPRRETLVGKMTNTIKSRQNTRKVEQFLKTEKKSFSKGMNGPHIFFLGPSDSGKTTFIRQMKLMHGLYSVEEKEEAKLSIFFQIASAVVALFELCNQDQREALVSYQRAIEACQKLMKFGPKQYMEFLLEKQSLQKFWWEPSIKAVWAEKGRRALPESTLYFLVDIDRILHTDFVPNIHDILKMSQKSLNLIVESVFEINNTEYRIFDVSGLKKERDHWTKFVKKIDLVTFVVALSCYNEITNDLDEIPVNRMIDTMELIKKIANNKLLKNLEFILFMNKRDLFNEKIKNTPINCAFPDYTGCADDPNEASAFISKKFIDLITDDSLRAVSCHLTCAIDTKSTPVIISTKM